MPEDESLVYGEVIPQGATCEGLYIDDLLAFRIALSRRSRNEGDPASRMPPRLRDDEIMESSRTMYSHNGWTRSMKKSFDKRSDFVAWGTSASSSSVKWEHQRHVDSASLT